MYFGRTAVTEDGRGLCQEGGALRRTRAGRPLRDRHFRVSEDTKQTKRLFTPEIKRFLKGWLVRRRKNPYPNRSEKKELALQTGLTYMQICNWFANWRRKLKKGSSGGRVSGRQGTGTGIGTGTWGPLIAGYNRLASGNVEQFSVSSGDSLWDETNYHSHSSEVPEPRSESPCQPPPPPAQTTATPALLKWLESAARFRPRDTGWGTPPVSWGSSGRHRAELDAAEALTVLSTARRGQCV